MAKTNQDNSNIGVNTKVVNQNDLLRIINASATTMKNVYNSIIALADACAFLKNMQVSRVKTTLNKMNQLLPYIQHFVLEINSRFEKLKGNIKNSIDGECELIKSIGTFTKNIYDILDIIKLKKLPNPIVYKFKIYTIIKVYMSIINQFTKDLVANFENIGTKFNKLGKQPDKIISNINGLIERITNILNSINSVKISSLLLIDLKLKLIRISFIKLRLLVSITSSTTPFISSSNKALKWMSENMLYLLQPIQTLSKISIFGLIGVRWKLKIIEHAWMKLSSLVIRIRTMKIGNTRNVKNKINIIKIVLGILGKIFFQILLIAPIALLSIPALAAVILGVIALTLSLKSIRILLEIAGKHKRNVLKLLTIKLLFAVLGSVFLLAILVAPIAAIASLALIVITLASGIMALCLWGIAWMLSKIPWGKLLIGLFFMNIAMLLIAGLASMLALISIAAVYVSDKLTDILILLLGIVMVVGIMGAIGFVIGTFLLPFMMPIIIGLLAMLVIIGIVWLMAETLKEIAEMDLDTEKIKANVSLVLSCVEDIISLIYSKEDQDPNRSDKAWYEDLFNYIGNGVGKIIAVICAVAILALTFVAVALIMLIAGELRLLQEIDLDPEKIKNNVDIVLDTAHTISSNIFSRKDEENTKSEKAWYESLIEYICDSQVFRFFQSLMNIAFLALTFVAVALIIFIAGELRLLQGIELDGKKITTNVDIVLDTAHTVSSNIFSRKDEENTKSEKAWYESLIEYICDSQVFRFFQSLMNIAFLACTYLSIMLIHNIAEKLNTLQEIELKSDIINTNVTKVIEVAHNVSNAIHQPDTSKEQPTKEDAWYMKMLNVFGFNDLGKIIKAVKSIGFLAATYGCIAIIYDIAEKLNLLSNIDLSKFNSENTVNLIIDAAENLRNKIITAKLKDEEGDDMEDIIDGYGRAIEFVHKMASSFNYIGEIDSSMFSVFDSRGKKIKKGIMERNIEGFFDIVKIILNTTYNYDKEIADKGWKENNLNDAVDELATQYDKFPSALEHIITSAKMIKDISDNYYSVGDREKVKSVFVGMKDIINWAYETAENVIAKGSGSGVIIKEVIETLQDLNKSLMYNDKQVTNTPKIFNETIKFVDKINGMDMQKLKTAENLFKNLADLSNNIRGNFQGLAEALNEDIAPLLEKLNATIEKANKQTGDSLGRIENYYSAMSGTNPDDIAMVDDNNQPLDEEQKEKVIKQNAQNTANQLYSNYQQNYKNSNEVNKSLVELTSTMRGIDRLIAILDPNLGPTPLRVKNI